MVRLPDGQFLYTIERAAGKDRVACLPTLPSLAPPFPSVRVLTSAPCTPTTCGCTHNPTLQRPGASSRSLESRILASRKFESVVQPDLPSSNTWQGLFARSRGAPDGDRAAPRGGLPEGVGVVQTVAVNRRLGFGLDGHIRHRVAECERINPGSHIRALLCVSGGDPFRKLPLVSRALPTSCALLSRATRLRDRGAIPRDVALWAVENPLLALDADRVRRKRDAGATTFVTQPPLLRGAFESWWDLCEQSALLEGLGVVVGIPVITSVRSLRFWLALCDAESTPEAEALLEIFAGHERAYAGDPEGMDAVCAAYVEDMVKWSSQLPHVSGLHLMPVSAKGYRQGARALEA